MGRHMSSRKPFALQGTDLLIRQALQAQVEGAEPSPRVWERIRRRARAWAARQRSRSAWGWNAALVRMSQAETAFSLPVVIQDGLVAWRYDPVAMRLLGYAGVMLRFGW